jgi:hypothetical protein
VNADSELTGIRDALGGATGTKYVYLDLTGSTIETIPANTFGGTSATDYTAALVGVTIPDGVTSIGQQAFLRCANLASVTIPDGVTSIGQQAFGSSGLTSITIPASVTSIGERVFFDANNLTRVVFETGSDIAEENFGDRAIRADSNYGDDTVGLKVVYLDSVSYSWPKAGAYLIEDSGTAAGYPAKYVHKAANTITLPAANVTTLTADTWANGNLPAKGEQLYKFTATVTGTQYIHVSIGTLSRAMVGVCGSDGYGITAPLELPNSYDFYDDYISLTVTPGQTYYIRVEPAYATGGTYKIAFNTTVFPPGTPTLTENTWEDGNIPQNGKNQWFKFTATVTGTQYIHVYLGTLTSLYVNVYNSSGTEVGSETRLSTNSSINRTVTTGETYYIRVRPYSSSYSGTYKIAYNESTTAPAQ